MKKLVENVLIKFLNYFVRLAMACFIREGAGVVVEDIGDIKGCLFGGI